MTCRLTRTEGKSGGKFVTIYSMLPPLHLSSEVSGSQSGYVSLPAESILARCVLKQVNLAQLVFKLCPQLVG